MSRYVLSSSSHPSTCRRGQVISEVALEAALNQITNSVASLQCDPIFTTFHPNTHIHRFIIQFNPDAFTDLVLQAFLVPSAALSQDEVSAVHNAKASLTEHLHHLDRVFEQIEAAGLDIGNIRSLFTWLRGRSHGASFKIAEGINPHPLYTDTVSPSPQLERVPRWGSNQYVGPSSSTFGTYSQRNHTRSPQDVSFSASNAESGRTASQSIAAHYGASAPHYNTPKTAERKRTATRPMTVRNDNTYSQHWESRSASVTSYNAREQPRHVNMPHEHEYSHFDASSSRSSTRWYPN